MMRLTVLCAFAGCAVMALNATPPASEDNDASVAMPAAQDNVVSEPKAEDKDDKVLDRRRSELRDEMTPADKLIAKAKQELADAKKQKMAELEKELQNSEYDFGGAGGNNDKLLQRMKALHKMATAGSRKMAYGDDDSAADDVSAAADDDSAAEKKAKEKAKEERQKAADARKAGGSGGGKISESMADKAIAKARQDLVDAKKKKIAELEEEIKNPITVW